MIVYLSEDENYVRTNGCSCCSCTYDIPSDNEKILENLVEQYVVLKKTLKRIKMSEVQFKRLVSIYETSEKSK